MAEQYNDAIEKLKDPKLREKYEREQRNYMLELLRESEKITVPDRQPDE